MAKNDTFCMFLTKIVIEVVSGMCVMAFTINLIVMVAEHYNEEQNLFEIAQIIKFCLSLFGFVLSLMAFVGACIENACLCQVTLGFCVILLFISVISILVCIFSKGKPCKSRDYVQRSVEVVIYFVMAMAVFYLIQGFKQNN